MNDLEYIFDDIIAELPKRTDDIKKVTNEFISILESMLLYSATDELNTLIHKSISRDIEQLVKQIDNCYNWIYKYNENLDVLSSGLVSNIYSNILEFNEAKNIFNDEFR